MLVDAQRMKRLRVAKNWTQQHLADVCGVSMRTIQRVEKDGVASNETVASYAAVFEMPVTELLISIEEFDGANRDNPVTGFSAKLGGVIFFGGFGIGIAAGVMIALSILG